MVAALVLGSSAEARVAPTAQLNWTLDRVALVLVALVVFVIATRSQLFGVDTAAYAAVLDSYCSGRRADELGLSFALSARLLNWAMLGACDIRLLPMAWVLLVMTGILLAAGSLSDKLRYLAVLLVSLVGIELTTNALRQGLSVALLVAAVSWWPRRWLVSTALGAASVVLHGSSALVLLAVAAAFLGWRWFLVAGGAATLVVAAALQRELTFGPVGLFLYEVQKYLAHEPDELWIRLLSFTSLISIVIIPRLAARPRDTNSVSLREGAYARSVRLVASSVPFLFLPYFGYRYIYGILPVVLWIAMRAVRDSPRLAAQTFALLLAANASLLAAWSYGSGYMRSIPFFE